MQEDLARNTMTVIELTGEVLAGLRTELEHDSYLHTLRIAVEVEPDGTSYYKVKANESRWSPPLEGGTHRVERLYDGDTTADPELPTVDKWQSLVHLAGHLGHGCTLAGDVLEVAGRDGSRAR